MTAALVGSVEIAANSGIDWFIHGYGFKDAFVFSIIPTGEQAPGVPFPLGEATLTQGQYRQHVDGTYAQLIHIQNNAPFNPCSVLLYEIVETAP